MLKQLGGVLLYLVNMQGARVRQQVQGPDRTGVRSLRNQQQRLRAQIFVES
jgi:hypothetical protein